MSTGGPRRVRSDSVLKVFMVYRGRKICDNYRTHTRISSPEGGSEARLLEFESRLPQAGWPKPL